MKRFGFGQRKTIKGTSQSQPLNESQSRRVGCDEPDSNSQTPDRTGPCVFGHALTQTRARRQAHRGLQLSLETGLLIGLGAMIPLTIVNPILAQNQTQPSNQVGQADNQVSGRGESKNQTQREIESLRSRIAELENQQQNHSEQQDQPEQQNQPDESDQSHQSGSSQPGMTSELQEQVIEDAKTRSRMNGNAPVAGHDGHFFIQSPDKNYRLDLKGHLQVRYAYNHRNDPGNGEDADQSGFDIRRLKFKPEGYFTVADQKIEFVTSLAGSNGGGNGAIFEDYFLEAPDFPIEGLSIRAGRFKQPFALQNLTSSSRQLGVERSAVLETFNIDRSEGVMLGYQRGPIKVRLATNDGAEAQATEFQADNVDYSVTGRVDGKIAGDWSQLKDPGTAWSDEPVGAFVGAAVHYQAGNTGTLGPANQTNNDLLRWTVDSMFEAQPFGVTTALFGQHSTLENGGTFDDYGALVEGGLFVIPDTLEPFVRGEYILADDDRPNVANGVIDKNTFLVGGGVNWYQQKHNAKFSADVIYAFGPLNGFIDDSDSRNLQSDAAGEDGQLALRLQYQIKW